MSDGLAVGTYSVDLCFALEPPITFTYQDAQQWAAPRQLRHMRMGASVLGCGCIVLASLLVQAPPTFLVLDAFCCHGQPGCVDNQVGAVRCVSIGSHKLIEQLTGLDDTRHSLYAPQYLFLMVVPYLQPTYFSSRAPPSARLKTQRAHT